MTSITLQVDLAERSYPIIIGAGSLKDEALLQQYIGSGQLMVVTNETIAPLYLDSLLNKLPNADSIILPDGEQFKQLATVERVFEALLNKRHNRTTTLLALGGGVVGDMTGFAAACYQRGVKFIQVPTTLLAQVDSSVGGKTGVNHPLGKNMIGSFKHPSVILMDSAMLKTLPKREFMAGMAEVIKYGLIKNKSFFKFIDNNYSKIIQQNTDYLLRTIFTCASIKAQVVKEDELEGGIRAI